MLLSVLPTLDSILKDFKQMYAAAEIRDVLLFQVSLLFGIYFRLLQMSISCHGLCGLNYLEKVSQTWSCSVGSFSEGLMCLSTSGNYTQVEILTGNS